MHSLGYGRFGRTSPPCLGASQSQVTMPQARNAFDASGRLIEQRLDQRVKDVGRQVARFAYLHTSQHALEFLRLWENAPQNPGGSDR